MAKYKLIALSVQISGKVFLKEDGDVFDTETTHAAISKEIEAMIDLLARARKDLQRIARGEFSTEVVFISLGTEPQTATVRALASKHHFSIDSTTGLPVNSKNTHCSVDEAVFNLY